MSDLQQTDAVLESVQQSLNEYLNRQTQPTQAMPEAETRVLVADPDSVLEANRILADAKHGASTPTAIALTAAPVTQIALADAPDPLPELPNRLKQIPNWVWWKLETRDGKDTKVPYVAGTNRHASSTDPGTWTSYENAVKAITLGAESGVGFVVNGVEQILGFDLDGCRNPQTGELTEWAESIVDALDSYTEVTPSLTGVRVWVRGVLPEGDRVFNLDTSAGYGEKVKIEVFESGRYFTVTGDSFFEETIDVESRDLAEVYKLCHDIRAKYPASRTRSKSPAGTEVKSAPVKVVTEPGVFPADKLVVLVNGSIKSTEPFVIEDNRGNSLEYPSHSEADLALATCLAIKLGPDPELIRREFEKSNLCRREKWLEREDYRDETIRKAITTANASKGTQLSVIQETTGGEFQVWDDLSTETIPAFDPSVITGIYAKLVELITRGTTLSPQFAFLAAKVVVGARMAGKVRFETLDAEPRYYGAAIGETGSGKGESWRRMMQILNAQGALAGSSQIKIINSADSGAGIRDAFFEHPQDWPILCYVDEVESLGNKATATRNPAILDTIIELANSTQISRTKANKKGDLFSGNRTKNDARFCMFMCGQDGDVYMKAFAGRTKLGMWDRLYPEFGEAVEAGELPPIHVADAFKLLSEMNELDYSGTMTMSTEARTRFEKFWANQSRDIKSKARWKNNLVLDAYMAAFGRGSKQVELDDIEIAIRIFTRQLVIRRVCFRSEVPDRIGFYLGKIKDLTKRMEKQIKVGVPVDKVALSRRDFETLTHAHRDNEAHIFERAWRTHEPVWLTQVKIKKANGQEYLKYLPFEE